MEVTDSFRKIEAMETPIKVIQGGQGAGKNYAIAQLLILEGIASRKTITVVTDTYPNLIDGAIKDFENIYESLGWDFGKLFNKSAKDLKCNESLIQFRYVNDVKSSSGKSKRRDVLYINEANKVGWQIAATYIGRTHGNVYIDYNPDFEFWAHTEIPKLTDDNGKSKSSQIIVTYKDNKRCPGSEVQFIECRKTNVEWYRVYGLGQTGFYSDKQIYKYEYVDEIPKQAKWINSGMDFGVSPDPTCLVELWLDRNDLYCDLVFSENGLMPEKIGGAQRMSIVDKMNELKVNKGHMIVADSAGAVEIRDLRKNGYAVRRSKKGAGSVIEGIGQLRGYNIKLTRKNTQIAKAIENYFFKTDKHRLDQFGNQLVIPEPDGHENDSLAAIRYAIMSRNQQVTKEQHNLYKNLIP